MKVKVSEVMLVGESVPKVRQEELSKTTVQVLNQKNIGAVLVIDDNNRLLGIVTDGDIRRCIADICNLDSLKACDIMTADPVSIDKDMLAADALSIMQRHEITTLPIVDDKHQLLGILHLHNLLGKGEFRFLV